MNRYGRIGLIFLVILVACTPQTHSVTPNATVQAGGSVLILATTTSTQDSGLLDVLIPRFEAQSGYQVKTVAVGSGQALKMGEEGNADVLLVHSPQAEEAFMQAGWGKDRVRVMHNDFVLLGPPSDPAQIRGLDVATALRTIAEKGVLFVSRGDNSGTHALELSLWRRLNLDPQGQPWYLETGQGMGATLMVAAEKQAYTLSDRGTFLAYRDRIGLEILVEGDKELQNIYHVITVNPERWPQVNYAGAVALMTFLVHPETQKLIASFGVEQYGQPLFFPDAGQP